MTPAELAALHAKVFTVPRPFTEREFSDLLSHPSCFLCTSDHGFALGRILVDEAELLTLVVDPVARRQGQGRGLLHVFETISVGRGAADAFLEVDERNLAAQTLYRQSGFQNIGERPGYYAYPDGSRSNAIVMRKSLEAFAPD